MTLIIGYNFRITIEDQMYYDLVEGTTDILTIPFTKDSIFKGDFLTLSPISNPNKHADFEIIGHVTSVKDKNGTPIKKTMRVKQIVDDSNEDVSSAQNHMKYLKAVDKRIDRKFQKLGDQIRSNLMTIEEKQRLLDVTNAFLYNLQCRRDMLNFMDDKEAFEKFKVELDNEDQLRSTIKEHQTRINQYDSLIRDLEIENDTLEKKMDDLEELKRYISNEIQLCEDEING
ncbi:hypothetical protein [uncultured Holdemanella sp.]|uniref:coiled-coil domain-containing protein n=1 Tax=uncultured Holdemanella sp. TaxID=1763549 RepID=UPI0025DC5867|nr:hypothetical protein [uncultured Holdemanella sp.]